MCRGRQRKKERIITDGAMTLGGHSSTTEGPLAVVFGHGRQKELEGMRPS